jgi:uncharacterized protein
MNTESELHGGERTSWGRILQFPLVRIVLAILAIAIPFAIVSLPFNPHAAREVGIGLSLGALLLTLTIGILAAVGAFQITGNNGWRIVLATVPGFILTGVLEEVVMRGVVFRILEQWLGSWIALGISAAIFGLLHLLNPGATLLNAAAISFEAGVLLAAAYMLTRRLWLCIGVHIAWNFTQGGIFSVAVSGGSSTGLLRTKMAGPDWLTGGSFGVEASVVALLVCAAAGIALLRFAAKKGRIVPLPHARPARRSSVTMARNPPAQ